MSTENSQSVGLAVVFCHCLVSGLWNHRFAIEVNEGPDIGVTVVSHQFADVGMVLATRIFHDGIEVLTKHGKGFADGQSFFIGVNNDGQGAYALAGFVFITANPEGYRNELVEPVFVSTKVFVGVSQNVLEEAHDYLLLWLKDT